MRKLCASIALAVLLVGVSAMLQGQSKTKGSDAQYIAEATSAAPASLAKDAAVIRMDEKGNVTPVREGKNGFTCMIVGPEKMCADANSMAFFDAWMKHQTPPDKLGLTYMLRGDAGASNTDPFSMTKTAGNHWVQTGSHVMIVGPGSKALGLPSSPDPDPTKPYMMWVGTPYEHAMIPVGGPKSMAKAAAPKGDAMDMKK